MASIAQSLPGANGRLDWLREWLRDELKPYPGRALLVARMVTAATLVMVICMTFRIPFAFQGALYALLISRESTRATLQSAATIFLVTGIGAAYLLVTAWFVINDPLFHFLWVVGSLFLAFYAISVLTNYLAAVIFAVMISAGIPLWDRLVPAEINVEDTLWLCLAALIGIVVTAGVELAFARLQPADEVVLLITERLSAVENLLTCYADGRAADSATEENVLRLEILGTSLLRRILRRSDHSPPYSAIMGGVAVLVGRLIDLAAILMQLGFEPSTRDRQRFRHLAATVGSIRNDLMGRDVPAAVHFDSEEQSASVIALLSEIEDTVTLIPQAFTGSGSIHEHLPSADDLPRPALLAADALVNQEHLHFALKGCLAASSCYVIYNAIAWPGINTAVMTCLLTALSTVGASRQKQMLRVTGAIAGGLLIGMGSQLFILPHLDSIAGFAVLFALVTTLSGWFMTSSPRLSYFGVQVALAFYLINLQEFTMQTSLSIARDRLVGILLGLFAMWLVFDQLWGTHAATEMKRTFISNLRLLAQLAREPLSNDLKSAIRRSITLRETININLDKVSALADGVLFEFGPSRDRDLELRSYVRLLQPELRTLFVMRIASLKYRLQLPGFELPESVRRRQQAYDDHSARLLEEMADRIEHNAPHASDGISDSHELLKETVQGIQSEVGSQLPAGRVQSLITLLRGIDGLTTSLASEIAMERGGLRSS
jgi:multidrug resistance protein MdtO